MQLIHWPRSFVHSVYYLFFAQLWQEFRYIHFFLRSSYSIGLLYISQFLCIRPWARVIRMMQKGALCLPICILDIPSFNKRFMIELQFGDSNLFNGVEFVFVVLNFEDLIVMLLRYYFQHIIFLWILVFLQNLGESMMSFWL